MGGWGGKGVDGDATPARNWVVPQAELLRCRRWRSLIVWEQAGKEPGLAPASLTCADDVCDCFKKSIGSNITRPARHVWVRIYAGSKRPWLRGRDPVRWFVSQERSH
jgi:hypothetical protein